MLFARVSILHLLAPVLRVALVAAIGSLSFATAPAARAAALVGEFGGATPVQWSARLAASEVARLGPKLAHPAASWDYANFFFLSSLLKLDTRLAQDRYLPFVKTTVDSFLSADGSQIQRFKLDDYNIDNVAPGRAVFALYDRTKDPRYRHVLDQLRAQLKTHPRTSAGGFWHKKRYPHQMWLDGLFMGSPFYAQYGRTFDEPAAFDDVAQQIRLVDQYTYDEKSGLFYHGWDESRTQSWSDKTTGRSPNFWSRAIGWYAMALVDVTDELPAGHPARAEIAAIFKRLADGLAKHQDPATGVWWQVTDQGPRKGNYLEATASSMFVYSMAKAINQGLLSRDHLPAVVHGYEGLIRTFIRTDAEGRTKLTQCCKVAGLGFGRDGSFAYYIGEPIIDNDPKGTAPFILAGIELEKLLGIATTPAAALAPAPAHTPPRSASIPAPSTATAPTASSDAASAHAWEKQMPAILARIKAPTFPKREFSIIDFGAPTDGKTDATDAIRKAIDACHTAGGGIVLVPAGTYLTGAIHLKSNVNLHLDEGSKLLFQTDPSHYPLVFSRWEGVECMNYSPFIYAYGQENIAITGKGTLDGQAGYDNWWGWVKLDEKTKPEKPLARASRNRLMAECQDGTPPEKRLYGQGHYLRPPFIQPYRCKNVLIENLTILRSPFWEVNPVLCENVTVRGLTIVSHGPNNDGVDPESCRDVLIENTLFDTGDDCIAIKSGRNDDGRRVNVPSENIIVRNSVMKDGHGGVTIGSEISGGCRNVFVENCKMDSPDLDRALRLKTNAVRGGTIENVYFRNVQVGRVSDSVVSIDFRYEEGDKGNFLPVVRNIVVENVTSRSSPRALSLRGFANAPIRGVRLVNCTFSGVEKDDLLEHIEGLEKINVAVTRTP